MMTDLKFYIHLLSSSLNEQWSTNIKSKQEIRINIVLGIFE